MRYIQMDRTNPVSFQNHNNMNRPSDPTIMTLNSKQPTQTLQTISTGHQIFHNTTIQSCVNLAPFHLKTGQPNTLIYVACHAQFKAGAKQSYRPAQY